ncbi:MAG: hypothetical protein E7324_03220 [Clostridiales bacterium]|nr:hypothetical protein [Clostridiales bacterium]
MLENGCILVCVTVQKDCGRLIERGRQAADGASLPLHVLHVSAGKGLLGNPDAAEALNYLYSLARQADAEMNILYEADAAGAIARYARQNGARQIIMGPDKSGFATRLANLLPPDAQVLSEGDGAN